MKRGILQELLIIYILLNLCHAHEQKDCAQNEVYDPPSQTCKACPPNCSKCRNQRICLSCSDSFYINGSSACAPCKTAHCKTCSQSFCSTCLDGYTVFEDDCTKINSLTISPEMIGGICVLLMVFISGLSYFIGKFQRRNEVRTLSFDPNNQRMNQEPSSILELNSDGHWEQIHEKRDSIIAEVCPICLDKLVNTQLSCMHFYHVQCIMKWVKIRHQCPLCKKNIQRSIKIYCSKCFDSSFEINSAFLILQGVPKQSTCINCESLNIQQEN